MRDLEQGLIADQSQSVAKNQTSAFVYVVTKIFPLLATGVFASTTDVKKPESIALSTAFVSSTALPVLADLLKLTGRSQLSMETLASFFMLAGVGMMDQGTIKEDNRSVRSIIALTAVSCFSLFATINTIYNIMKLAGRIQDKKPGVELVSSSFGLIGSMLFLVGNTLGLIAQQDAGKPIDAAARMIAVASCFTLSTALHTVLAGRAVCVKKPEDGALTEVVTAERSLSSLSAGNDVRTLEQAGRVTMGTEFLAVPSVAGSTPSSDSDEAVPGSHSPIPRELTLSPRI